MVEVSHVKDLDAQFHCDHRLFLMDMETNLCGGERRKLNVNCAPRQ